MTTGKTNKHKTTEIDKNINQGKQYHCRIFTGKKRNSTNRNQPPSESAGNPVDAAEVTRTERACDGL